jgi:hypothetical protein
MGSELCEICSCEWPIEQEKHFSSEITIIVESSPTKLLGHSASSHLSPPASVGSVVIKELHTLPMNVAQGLSLL